MGTRKSDDGSDRVEAYLNTIEDPAKRRALADLRTMIKQAAPDAEEVITYGMPGFRQGRVLVSYSAFKNHCSFFPMSDHIWDLVAEDPNAEQTSKGTIQFQPERPLSERLVRGIVEARLKENSAQDAAKKGA